MTACFGPQNARAALSLPSGSDVQRYGTAQTFVKDCSAPGRNDGTILDAAFYNRIIGNLDYVVSQSGVTAVPGDMTALYRAILGAMAQGAPELLNSIQELANAINDDPSFAVTMMTALNNRVRYDGVQILSIPQRVQALANMGVTFGIAASNAVQLDALAKLPGVDGSALTNIIAAWANVTGKPSFATVATSGAYADLSGKPTLGTAAALNVGTANGNVVQLDATTGKLPAVDGSLLTGVVATAVILRSYLAGLGLSTAGSSNTFAVAPGVATDSGNTVSIPLAASISKTTASWAVGSGNGALLDAGSIVASQWYHVLLIERLDTHVVDVGVSTSLTPTLPTNYTVSRRIGSIMTDASSKWLAFKQYGDDFILNAVQLEMNSSTPPTVLTTRQLVFVPQGVSVRVYLRSMMNGTAAGTEVLIASADETVGLDGDATSRNRTMQMPVSGFAVAWQGDVRTDTSANIKVQANASANTLNIQTIGYKDSRGRDA